MNFAMIDSSTYHYLIACIQDGDDQGSLALVGTQLLRIDKLANRCRDTCRCIVRFVTETKYS
jgi:hypothetical protein